MAEIDAKTVARLRAETGAGMMACKTALADAEGDFEKAKEILRAKGELDVKKRASRSASEGKVHAYIHPGDKVGVLVEVNCETDFVAKTELFQNLIHDLALHIAFANPDYLSRQDVPEEVVAKERTFLEQQAAESGKPQQVVVKIVDGQMRSFFEDRCLLDQPFVRDEKRTIKDIVTEAAAQLGENVQVRRFVRFQVGV